ncbi:MAG: hypothetical protein IT210_05240 [Armatimonadetes bacterium]|nr:hypothetical protein [Armatimonadota bacterium]
MFIPTKTGEAAARELRVRSGMTWRGILAGLVGSLVLGVGAVYGTMQIRGSYMDIDFSTAGAVFLFFILVGIINSVLGRLRRSWALSPAELITAYAMMVVASAIPTMGFTAQILSIISSPSYYANATNRWGEIIAPHLKPWAVPHGKETIRAFYEGMPGGATIPWMAWIKPLLAWMPLMISLYVVMICMMVLIRRQWADRERLAYPITQLPTDMVGEPTFWKNRLMWAGFLIPFAIGSLIGLHYYYPSIPMLNLVWRFPWFRSLETLVLRISLPMIGFLYLVNLDTLFSLWFFNLVAQMVRGTLNIMAVEFKGFISPYGSPSPIFGYLGMGAMIALVLVGLRTARPHLKEVWRKVIGKGPQIDDSGEILPYRQAFVGMTLGLVVMAVWLSMSGIPPLALALFLAAAFLLFYGLTRVVVESGMAEAVASTIAPGIVTAAFGTSVAGQQGMAALGLTYVWTADIRTFVMASAAHNLKMAETVPGRRRGLFWAMLLAIAVTMASTLWLTIYLAYHRGAINLNSWFFNGGPIAAYTWVGDRITNPVPPSGIGWALMGSGFAFMTFLMYMRQTFLWWPFHPIGFCIGTTWIMDELWFTCFLAWFFKFLIVRYGGLRQFRNFRPFFLGLILGQFVCNGMWLIIDGLTGQQGNQIFWI